MSAWLLRRVCSEELAACHQTPTLIGCIFLRNRALKLALNDLKPLQFSLLAAISEAFDCSTVFTALLKRFCVFFSPLVLKREKKTPGVSQAFWRKSLTMTYFHTGTRTIIGANSFHCPVRDGKEWYQIAMVIRHKLFVRLTACFSINFLIDCAQSNEFIESLSAFRLRLFGITWIVLIWIHPVLFSKLNPKL